MATLADLNVRIGAITKGLEQGLQKAERRIDRAARKFDNAGNRLTVAVSVPLIGLGTAAIQSAGDFENLENALSATMGSTEAARVEMEKLRKVAMDPGLDFEQAVKGSVRLQAVGVNAELARRSLAAVGNALTLAGGTAADLDGVTLALTQIISKGKVSAEEINQLAERVPQIRKAMKDAFGTADTEELQKMKISSEEFVEKIITEFEKLPKAQGGIKNSITNLGAAIRQNLADLGKDINETFNLSELIDSFVDRIQQLVQGYKALNPETKEAILKTAAFAVALGPALKIAASLYSTFGLGINILRGTIQHMTGLVNTVGSLTKAFMALNAVQKLSVLGAAAAAVFVVVKAYQSWRRELEGLTAVSRTMKEVNTQAQKAIAGERLEAEKLVGVIKDENTTRAQKAAALQKLKGINKEYFGDLDLEKGKIEKIDTALQNYISTLEQRAKLVAANNKLIEIEEKLLDVTQRMEEAKPGFFQTAGNILFNIGNAAGFAYDQVSDLTKNLQEQERQLKAQKQALLDYIKANESITTGTAGSGSGTGVKRIEAGDLLPPVADIRTSAEQIAGILEKSITKKVPLVKAATEQAVHPLTQLQEQFEIIDAKAEALGESFDPTAAKISILENAIASFVESGSPFNETVLQMQVMLDGLRKNSEGVAAGMNQVATSMQNAAQQGVSSLQELGKVALKSAADFVRAKIMEAIAGLIAKEIGTKGIFGIPIAAAGAAIVGTLFNKLLTSVKVPAFAEGGMVTKPTLALLGDNPSGKEAVIPYEKMPGLFNSGLGNMELSTRISARDLLFIIRQAERDMGRTNPY